MEHNEHSVDPYSNQPTSNYKFKHYDHFRGSSAVSLFVISQPVIVAALNQIVNLKSRNITVKALHQLVTNLHDTYCRYRRGTVSKLELAIPRKAGARKRAKAHQKTRRFGPKAIGQALETLHKSGLIASILKPVFKLKNGIIDRSQEVKPTRAIPSETLLSLFDRYAESKATSNSESFIDQFGDKDPLDGATLAEIRLNSGDESNGITTSYIDIPEEVKRRKCYVAAVSTLRRLNELNSKCEWLIWHVRHDRVRFKQATPASEPSKKPKRTLVTERAVSERYTDLGRWEHGKQFTVLDTINLRYFRVFSRGSTDLNLGGRYYNSLISEILSHHRRCITIDGIPIAGFDYKSLHPLIAYAIVQQRAGMKEIDLGNIRDCYDIGLKHTELNLPTSTAMRNLVKLVLLTILNIGKKLKQGKELTHPANVEVLRKAINFKWRKDRMKLINAFLFAEAYYPPQMHQSDPRELPVGWNNEQIEAALVRIIEVHQQIAEFFGSDFGVTAQYHESEMLTRVAREMVKKKCPLLLVHDQAYTYNLPQEQVWLKAAMLDAFEQNMGIRPPEWIADSKTDEAFPIEIGDVG